jgi:hypothetical protein
MTEEKSKIVELEWVGGSRKDFQQKYRGDGHFCDVDQPSTCIIRVSIDQAYQLMIDMPTRWKVISKNEELKAMLETYSNRMMKDVPEKKSGKADEKKDKDIPNYNWILGDLEGWAEENDVFIPEGDKKEYEDANKTQKKSFIWKLIKEKLNK